MVDTNATSTHDLVHSIVFRLSVLVFPFGLLFTTLNFSHTKIIILWLQAKKLSIVVDQQPIVVVLAIK